LRLFAEQKKYGHFASGGEGIPDEFELQLSERFGHGPIFVSSESRHGLLWFQVNNSCFPGYLFKICEKTGAITSGRSPFWL